MKVLTEEQGRKDAQARRGPQAFNVEYLRGYRKGGEQLKAFTSMMHQALR